MTTRQSMYPKDESNEELSIFQYNPREETQEGRVSFKGQLLKWLGALMMFGLGAATFMPNALHIPADFRPWVFVTFLLWLFAFCEGIFS